MPAVEQFYSALLERVAALPGVEAASLTTAPPLTGGNDITAFPEGQRPASQTERRFAQVRFIQGRYFDAAGVRILKGRALDDNRETPAGPPAAVISETMAASYFPGVDPIGRRIVADFNEPVTAEIVGIAADVRVFGQGEAPPDTLYLSARQSPTNFLSIVARTATPASGFGPALRAIVRDLDPALAQGEVVAMTSLLADSVAGPRFRTGLIAAFASVALALTVVGLYGTLAYAVSQRTREIGIRFALGARAGSIRALVLRQGALFVAMGAGAGLIAAFWATRLLGDMLFRVTPRDATVFAGVPILLGLVAALAMIAPARRAAKLEPVKALRT
jgi:predicted permease